MDVFTYKLNKDGTVFIYWHYKHVTTLRGSKAERFIENIENAGDDQAQLIMAKVTGNFKRGNEKTSKTQMKGC